MARRPAGFPPAYQLHSGRNLARVTLGTRDVYLGPFGSRESYERYAALLLCWASQQPVPDDLGTRQSVRALGEMYLEYARTYYVKRGKPTSQVDRIKAAVTALMGSYGGTAVDEFGPRLLESVREDLVRKGLARTYINSVVKCAVRMFKWGVSREIVPPNVYAKLDSVEPLKRGRSEAREPNPVEPVSTDVVDRTLPHLTGVVADMVRLQRLTGARPGEICVMRPVDLAGRGDGLLIYTPSSHKLEHKQKHRMICLGPKAQEVLRPWLERDPLAYCFSPRESEELRHAARRAARATPMTPSQAARTPKPEPKRPRRDHYSTDSYRRAIWYACDKAGVPRWSPNQLRHASLTEIRGRYGLDGARVVAGHSDASTTEVYAQRDLDMAAKVMLEIG